LPKASGFEFLDHQVLFGYLLEYRGSPSDAMTHPELGGSLDDSVLCYDAVKLVLQGR